MRYPLMAALAGAMVACGAPVSAQEAGLSTWIVEEPTELLGAETAALLREGKGFFTFSTSALPLAGGPLSSTVGSEAWNSRDLKSRPH